MKFRKKFEEISVDSKSNAGQCKSSSRNVFPVAWLHLRCRLTCLTMCALLSLPLLLFVSFSFTFLVAFFFFSAARSWAHAARLWMWNVQMRKLTLRALKTLNVSAKFVRSWPRSLREPARNPWICPWWKPKLCTFGFKIMISIKFSKTSVYLHFEFQ